MMKKVFAILPDFDNFRYLLETPETSKLMVERMIRRRREWDAREMRYPEYQLFVDPRKKKDKRRMDFNISCYHDLLCDAETKQKFEAKLGDDVFIFPIKTDLDRDFYFVALQELPASIGSLFDNPQTYDKRYKYYFSAKVIANKILFVDSKGSSSPLATQEFIDWATENDIKGMRFEFAGYIKDEL